MPRRKRFGQHFLRDDAVVRQMVAAVAPAPDDRMVEIGPGDGVLTQHLAERVARLELVEIDRDLQGRLANRFADCPSVCVTAGDALRFDYGELAGRLGRRLRIVGNIAYNISSPLIFRLLQARHAVIDMHFMLQKEVVDRLVADPGSRTYGRLTVGVNACAEATHLFDVPPQAFDPPPRVESAVVRLRLREPQVAVANHELFTQLVTAAFGKRRKTLRNALRDWSIEIIAEQCRIDTSLRPERLTSIDFIRLANAYFALADQGANEKKREHADE